MTPTNDRLPLLRPPMLARRGCVAWLNGEADDKRDWDHIAQAARTSLEQRRRSACPSPRGPFCRPGRRVFEPLARTTKWPIVPVYCENHTTDKGPPRLLIAFGTLLPPSASPAEACQAIEEIGRRV